MAIELPKARSVSVNPTQDQLRQWVAEMPNAQLTEFGNFNVKARVTARSAGSTSRSSGSERTGTSPSTNQGRRSRLARA